MYAAMRAARDVVNERLSFAETLRFDVNWYADRRRRYTIAPWLIGVQLRLDQLHSYMYVVSQSSSTGPDSATISSCVMNWLDCNTVVLLHTNLVMIIIIIITRRHSEFEPTPYFCTLTPTLTLTLTLIFQPQNQSLSTISHGHSLYQLWTLWGHSFLSYAVNKQTEGLERPTTPTDIVGVWIISRSEMQMLTT